MKILHSADWHLGSPFSGRSPEETAFLRRRLAEIPEEIARVCRAEGCDLVLLAGDLLDGPVSRDTVELLAEKLAQCAVPVFISPGNHDFLAPDSPWLDPIWPENVHIFTGELESVAIPALDCRIYGAGYKSMDCEGLLEGFRAAGDERWQIAVLHGDPTVVSSPYCPITAAQIRASGLDYLALGHIHKAGSIREGKTLCAWPGCPMGRGFDETGEKGVYLVEMENGAEIRFLPLNTLRFYDLEAEIEGDALAALEALLPAADSKDFYRVTLTGYGEPDLPALYAHFARCTHLELRDRTEPEADLWEAASADTLEGNYFRLLHQAMEDADPATAERILLAARLSHRLLCGKEVLLP